MKTRTIGTLIWGIVIVTVVVFAVLIFNFWIQGGTDGGDFLIYIKNIYNQFLR